MALDKIEYSRMLIKRTDQSGVIPTIPPVSAVTLNQLIPTDLLVGEWFANVVDDLVWLRTENGILQVSLSGSTGSTGTQNLSQVLYRGNDTDGINILVNNGGTIQYNGLSTGTPANYLAIDASGNTISTQLPTLTGEYLPLSGGTVTGATKFTSTFSLSNLTSGGSQTFLTIDSDTGQVYTATNPSFTGAYLPLSGGTVSGGTNFTRGLTASTLNITTLGTGTSITNLGIDIRGNVVSGTGGSSSLRQDITYISTGTQAGIIMVADGKIYAIKSNNGGDDFFAGANWPSSFGEGSRNGIPNMIEIPIPGETGTLVECKANGPGAYALFDNGNLYTWGYNDLGWCGVGSTSSVYYPTLASTGVTNVYTHPSNNCGESYYARLVIKKNDNKIYGTGYNGNYELGLGDATNRTSFTELTWAGTNPISVWNVGAWGGAIIVQKSDGTLIMSGYNNNGQLGLGSTVTPTFATSASSNAWLSGDTTYRIEEILFNGRYFNNSWQTSYNSMTMLLRNNSGTRLVTSGNNNWGRIGDGTTTQRLVPTAPTGTTFNTIQQIASKGGGEGDTYVLKTDGTLWGWGRNQQGALGIGNTTQQTTPILIQSGVTRMLQGMPSTWTYAYQMPSVLLEKTDGYYNCGFNNNGELGVGIVANPIQTWTRIDLPYSTRFKYLGETCTVSQAVTRFGITTDNQIWAWGYNGYAMIEPSGANAWQPLKYSPSILLR